VSPYCLTFLSRGKKKHPYPNLTALIKTRIGLGWVFLIAFGFNIPKPIKKYPLECGGQKYGHKPLSYK
jgi:hypothetical protein